MYEREKQRVREQKLEAFVKDNMKLSFKVAEELNTKQFVDMSNYQEIEKQERDIKRQKRDSIVVHVQQTEDDEYEIDQEENLREQEYKQSQLMSQGHGVQGEDHISR